MRVRDEGGLSLIEVMAASAITLAVLALLATVFTRTIDVDTYTGRDAEALAALRATNDRLARDLRQAGKIYVESYYCGDVGRMVKLWLNKDGDAQQQPSERITWEVQPTGDGLARIVRWNDQDEDAVTYSANLVWNEPADYFTYFEEPSPDPVPAACYDPDAGSVGSYPNPTRVSISLVADIDTTRSPVQREVRTDVQLRNVPS